MSNYQLKRAFYNKKPLITFIMAGEPNLSATSKIILELEKCGADIIELGIPFSDSIADGPIITEAAQRAINNGVTTKDCFHLVKSIRKKTTIPIVFMTSYNIIHSYGVKKFIKDCSKVKVNGLIIPDLPIEEAKKIFEKSKQNNIDLIFLIAPNTCLDRAKKIAKLSQGFIYYISLTGTTGIRKKLPLDMKANVKKIKSITKKPVAVGFGISTPQQAKDISKFADGIIIGSAIVKKIKEKKSISNFVKAIKKAIS